MASIYYLSKDELSLVEGAIVEALHDARSLQLDNQEASLSLMLCRLFLEHGLLRPAMDVVAPVYERLSAEPERCLFNYHMAAMLMADLALIGGDVARAAAIIAQAEGFIPETDDIVASSMLRLDLGLVRAQWSTDTAELAALIDGVNAFVQMMPGIEKNWAIVDIWRRLGLVQLRYAYLQRPDMEQYKQGLAAANVTFSALLDYGERFHNPRSVLYGLGGIAQCITVLTDTEKEQLLTRLEPIIVNTDALPAQSWVASLAAARLLKERGDMGAACLALERCIHGFEKLGGTLQREDAIMRFFVGKVDIYAELVGASLLDGRQANAFHFSERAKSKALIKVISRQVQGRRQAEQTHAARGLGYDGGALEIEEVIATLRALDQLGQTNTAVVEWILEGGYLHTFCLVSSQLRTFTWEINHQALHTIAARSMGRMITLDDLRFLFGALWAPLMGTLEHFGADTLCVVPHGILHRLPFAAAWDERRGRPMNERFVISQIPTARLLRLSLTRWQERQGRQGEVLLVPDPIASLPHSPDEIAAIARLYANRQVSVLPQATGQMLVNQAPQAQIIHFAGHTIFNPQAPMQSGLLMQDKHIFAAYQIVEYLNANNCRLVTLSSCGTSKTRVTLGEEILGLPRALLHSGTVGFIGTLWEVSDPSTAYLMREFYRRWLDLGDRPFAPARALSAALTHLRNITRGELAAYYKQLGTNTGLAAAFDLKLGLDSVDNIYDLTDKIYKEPYYWSSFIFTGV